MMSTSLHAYDPSTAGPEGTTATAEFTATARDRKIPLRYYLPKETKPCPVILFSHGLGGSRDNSAYLGKHWSSRGYVVIFMQHIGSDEALWKDKEGLEASRAMMAGASVASFMQRTADVVAVLDQITAWNKEKGHALYERLDLTKIGMSGHSFGAITTQALSGQSFKAIGQKFTDSRIIAALALSPSKAQRMAPEESFAKVSIPWMLMTGTKDVARMGPIVLGDDDANSRREVFAALQPGDKYELVFDGAEHGVFSDRPLPGEKERAPHHHPAILAISTAYWDTYLRNDSEAKTWLNSDQPRKKLEAKDIWQVRN